MDPAHKKSFAARRPFPNCIVTDELRPQRPQRWIKGPLLGAGAFGAVHRCLCLSTGTLLAVKSSSASPHSPQMTALEREIGFLQQLKSSAHVIRYLGESWTVEGGVPTRNLAMECAVGGSLSSLLKLFGKGVGLPEAVVRRYTRDLLLGLRDIHGMGVAHLDIKGGNSLLTESGVKIGDFGAARVVPGAHGAANRSWEGPVEMRGTLCWMAPEVVNGDWGGTEADIWSLGCTVLEMLTGTTPWASECGEQDWRAVMARIGCTKDTPGIPSTLSDCGRDFLEKCLVRDPKGRWIAEALLEHPFLAGGPQQNANVYASSPFGPLGSSPVSVLSPLRSFELSTSERVIGEGAATPWEASLTGLLTPADMEDQEGDRSASMINAGDGRACVDCCRADGSGAREGAEAEGEGGDEEEEGHEQEHFALFFLCSGLPSPMLLSPLQEVAAALGAPLADTMEGYNSWICQQPAAFGLIQKADVSKNDDVSKGDDISADEVHEDDDDDSTSNSAMSVLLTSGVPLARPTLTLGNSRPFPSALHSVAVCVQRSNSDLKADKAALYRSQ